MQHRDKIILQKIVSEINIAFEMIGETEQEEFLTDEKLRNHAEIINTFFSLKHWKNHCFLT